MLHSLLAILNAVDQLKHNAQFVHFQTAENALIKTRIKNSSGVCLHNGVVYKDKDEWTVDSCTHCTCQVSLQLDLNDVLADVPIKQIAIDYQFK